MYARRITGRNQRWGSAFGPSKYLVGPNCQDHTCSQSLNRTTLVGNCYPQGSSTSRYLLDLISSRAVAPGSSHPGLHGRAATTLKNNQLRVYSSTSLYSPKAKPKEEITSEKRLNDQIKAQFVRLVTEEGHTIVSRYEALDRARKLKLDLVEVQRNADPPVCKIMNFHKEKYQRQLQEKDRAKAKSEVTLRKGDCKEVRFSGKIEQKDLKMKADTVIRLMENGYRVKCMILPKGKDEYVEELLSRFTALIEDVSVVESGPVIVEKKMVLKPKKKLGKRHEEKDEKEQEEKRQINNAYMIVRHVKFGAAKKGGVKKLKVGNTGPKVEKVATELPAVEPFPALCEEDPAESGLETKDKILPDEVDLPIPPQMEMRDTTVEDQKTAWSVLDSRDDVKEVFDFSDDAEVASSNSTNVETNAAPETDSSPTNFNVADFLRPKPVLDSTRASEPRNQFTPTKSMDNRGPDMRDSARSEPQFPNPRREPRNQFTPTKSMDNRGPYTRDSARSEPQFPNQRREPRNQFTPSKSMDNRGPDMRDSASSEPQFPNQRREPLSNMNASHSMGEKKQFENASVFKNSNLPPNGRPKEEPSHPVAPNTPVPSYGIFSTPKTNGPGKQGVAADAHRNREGNPFDSAGVRANQSFPGLKSDGSERPGTENGGQGKWGIFSREGSNVTPNRISKTN